jgi:hypothetical protein
MFLNLTKESSSRNGIQAVKTNGYMCETLGSAAAVAAQYRDLSGAAIVDSSSILKVFSYHFIALRYSHVTVIFACC